MDLGRLAPSQPQWQGTWVGAAVFGVTLLGSVPNLRTQKRYQRAPLSVGLASDRRVRRRSRPPLHLRRVWLHRIHRRFISTGPCNRRRVSILRVQDSMKLQAAGVTGVTSAQYYCSETRTSMSGHSRKIMVLPCLHSRSLTLQGPHAQRTCGASRSDAHLRDESLKGTQPKPSYPLSLWLSRPAPTQCTMTERHAEASRSSASCLSRQPTNQSPSLACSCCRP